MFLVGVFVGSTAAGAFWSGATVMYRRRWREALWLAEQIDESRHLSLPARNLTARKLTAADYQLLARVARSRRAA